MELIIHHFDGLHFLLVIFEERSVDSWVESDVAGIRLDIASLVDVVSNRQHKIFSDEEASTEGFQVISGNVELEKSDAVVGVAINVGGRLEVVSGEAGLVVVAHLLFFLRAIRRQIFALRAPLHSDFLSISLAKQACTYFQRFLLYCNISETALNYEKKELLF